MFSLPNLPQKWPFIVGLFKSGPKKDATLHFVGTSLRCLLNRKVSSSPLFSTVVYLLWKLVSPIPISHQILLVSFNMLLPVFPVNW